MFRRRLGFDIYVRDLIKDEMFFSDYSKALLLKMLSLEELHSVSPSKNSIISYKTICKNKSLVIEIEVEGDCSDNLSRLSINQLL